MMTMLILSFGGIGYLQYQVISLQKMVNGMPDIGILETRLQTLES
jgi:hypothetical protein